MSTRRWAGACAVSVLARTSWVTGAQCRVLFDVILMGPLAGSDAHRRRLASGPAILAELIARSTVTHGEPYEINQDLIRTQQSRHPAKGCRAVGNDHDLGRRHDLLDRRAHQRGNVGKFAIQIALVRANESLRPHLLIVDTHLISSADEGFHQRHRRTLANVVRPSLEAQAEHPDSLASGLLDEPNAALDL